MEKQIRVLGTILRIAILVCLCSCSFIIDQTFSPSEIKDGFSEKWFKTLSNEYHISIPKSASYLKEFYGPGQDFSVHMLFTVNADDFENMVGDGWTEDAEGHF